MSVNGQNHRTRFRDESISYTLTAVTAPTRTPLIAAVSSKYTIYVQRIEVHVITTAVQTITFEASGGQDIAVLPASATAGDNHTLIEDPEGVPLPAGENLNVAGAAGVACTITVTAYQRVTPGAVLLPSQL